MTHVSKAKGQSPGGIWSALNHQEGGLTVIAVLMSMLAFGACYSAHDLLGLFVAEMPEHLRFKFEVVRISTAVLGIILALLSLRFIWMVRNTVSLDKRTAFMWVFIVLAGGFGALFLLTNVMTSLNDFMMSFQDEVGN